MAKIEKDIMKKNLDKILDNIVLLADEFGFREEIDKFILMNLLISYGYLSKDKKIIFDKNILYTDLYDDIIFELGIVPITGAGCCRHITSLAKLILDKFKIENNVAATLVTNSMINSNEMLQISELIGQELECNHAVNVAKLNGKYVAFDLAFDQMADLYSIDKNLLTRFFRGQSVKGSYLIYNYSPFFEGRKNFDKIEPFSMEEQENFVRECNNMVLVTRANLDLLDDFYRENKPYMDEIDTNYQKVFRR